MANGRTVPGVPAMIDDKPRRFDGTQAELAAFSKGMANGLRMAALQAEMIKATVPPGHPLITLLDMMFEALAKQADIHEDAAAAAEMGGDDATHH